VRLHQRLRDRIGVTGRPDQMDRLLQLLAIQMLLLVYYLILQGLIISITKNIYLVFLVLMTVHLILAQIISLDFSQPHPQHG
jgi:hypothetical protein